MTPPMNAFSSASLSESAAFRRALIRAIIYPVVLLLILIAIFLWQLSNMSRTNERVEHSNAVIDQASNVLKLLVDMETGLRGYLLTSDSRFLEPYSEAEVVFDADFAQLQNLITDNADQTRRLQQIATNFEMWRQFAIMSIDNHATDRVDDVETQLVGKQQMDTLRNAMVDFVDTEYSLRDERIQATETTLQWVVISVMLGGLVIGGLLVFVTRQQLIRLSQRYQRSLTVSRQQEAELTAVLSSIGDAVLATDTTGNVTFINQITEQLTGWSAAEAAGKPLSSVYRVVEQDAPASSATSPLEKIYLKHLIDRSGKAIAIDDSSAPIKDVSGTPLGSVIVFRDATRRQVIEQERLRLIEAQTRYSGLLRRSNEQLQQFAYIASHDLQEPLRMVVSYLELLQKRYANALDTDAQEFIGYAVDGAIRMKALIAGLLQYSRLETGEQNIHTLISLDSILDKTLTNLSVAITDSGATITHDPLPHLQADSLQMMQLFQNLISNGMKFRGKEPIRIHIGAVQHASEWRFSVQDNGIGIAPEYRERIFGMFQRLHTRAAYEGTGIGLAVCQKIVERHHGRIWVESTVGQGSTFYFTLPLKQPEADKVNSVT